MAKRIPLDEDMLISAVRYALGRKTYIVGMTVDEVFRVWPKLSKNRRAVILRDIKAERELVAFMGWEMSPEWDRIPGVAANA